MTAAGTGSQPVSDGDSLGRELSFDKGRTGRHLADIAEAGRGALVGFLHVGFPDVPTSLDAMRTLTGGGDSPGVDMVEVGMPYSDPMMDGVIIQRAGTQALQRGVRTRDAFAAVEAVASTGTPVVVMTYWNLIERYGPQAFARDLAAAGGSGAVTPDLTPDEADAWFQASDQHALDRIFLVSPSSSDARIASTVAACRGWVYATSVMGVTGARAETSTAAPALVHRVRAADANAMVGVGLGVSTALRRGRSPDMPTRSSSAPCSSGPCWTPRTPAHQPTCLDCELWLRTWPTAYAAVGRTVQELPVGRAG